MRKFLLKIINLISSGLRLKKKTSSLTFTPKDPQNPAVYRLAYKPVNEKIIGSLRSRGWNIILEINEGGELEYSINLEKSTAIAAEGK